MLTVSMRTQRGVHRREHARRPRTSRSFGEVTTATGLRPSTARIDRAIFSTSRGTNPSKSPRASVNDDTRTQGGSAAALCARCGFHRGRSVPPAANVEARHHDVWRCDPWRAAVRHGDDATISKARRSSRVARMPPHRARVGRAFHWPRHVFALTFW